MKQRDSENEFPKKKKNLQLSPDILAAFFVVYSVLSLLKYHLHILSPILNHVHCVPHPCPSPPQALSAAGLGAGLTEAVVVNPFEVVKVSLQANRDSFKEVDRI